MNLEPNNKSLSFAEFLDAAIRDKAEAKPFPYFKRFTTRSRSNLTKKPFRFCRFYLPV